MKKGLIVAFGLMAVVLLSGCGSKDDGNKAGNSVWGGKSIDNMYEGVSFTLDELDSLEERLFPVSYSYTTYNKEDWSITDFWEYIYQTGDNHLLPIEEKLVDREVSSSEVKNGMVYSMVDAKLDENNVVSILYINNPETLKYSFATLYAENETTLYTFSY